MSDITSDPMDAASNPQERQATPTEYYGRVAVSAWFCVLQKGVGKAAYEKEIHNPDDRRTSVDFEITPISDMNLKYSVKRSMLSESKEYANLVWPSIKAQSISSLRELDGKFARVQLVQTGRSWQNRAGETVQATTLEFLAVYESEEACRAAYWGSNPQVTRAAQSNGDIDYQQEKGDAERDAAMKVLTMFASQGKTKGELQKLLAGYPNWDKHIDWESDEVIAILTPK